MPNSKYKPKLTLQHILNEYLDDLVTDSSLNSWQSRVFYALKACKTGQLGEHWEVCESCGVVKIHYNSCGNRHCPGCQGANRERWLLERTYDLFDVPHHHVTFTVPRELRVWFRMNEKKLYSVLFNSMWATLLSFSKDKKSRLEAQIGVISILHTWTQKLEYHPHVHCIVPSGGLTDNGKWKSKSGKFLFYVPNLSLVFKAKFCHELQSLNNQGELQHPKGFRSQYFDLFIDQLQHKDWVVNSKSGFKGKESVLEYLGRYTHKIAISNYRLIKLENDIVTFSYRDRAAGDTKKTMQLPAKQFLLRFAQHILPKGFVKIRHYGLFSTRVKAQLLAQVRSALGQKQLIKPAKLSLAEVILQTTGVNVLLCSSCKEGQMKVFKVIHPARGSPRILPPTKQLQYV